MRTIVYAIAVAVSLAAPIAAHAGPCGDFPFNFTNQDNSGNDSNECNDTGNG